MGHSYLIISGTNRPKSNTLKIAELYKKALEAKGVNSAFFTLEGWQWLERNPSFEKIQQEVLIPADRLIFILPEYNGSIPGVLKLMIDISNHKTVWPGKKALLVGVSTGRAGNLRGLEHMTGILNFLHVVVHPNKLPISGVDKLFNTEGEIADADTLIAIDNQLNQFIEF